MLSQWRNFLNCRIIHITGRNLCCQNFKATRLHSNSAMISSRSIPKSGTICIEGNIGCGKTTLLDYFRSHLQALGDSEPSVFAEPVERWRNVDGENLFHYLYKDPTRYSLAFQTFVQLTMTKIHMRRPKLMERSIYSARYCFVENLYRLNYLSRLEYIILDKWFKHIVLEGQAPLNGHGDQPQAQIESTSALEHDLLCNPTGVKIDLIVYLRCQPQKVMERIKTRSRAEEKDISIEYIKSLHNLHEDWLIHRKFPIPAPVLVLNTDCQLKSLEKLYAKAAPYISGEKKILVSPTIIQLTEDDQ